MATPGVIALTPEQVLEAQIANASRFFVGGMIANSEDDGDTANPLRYGEWLSATTWEEAEDAAKARVRSEEVNGAHGELLVTNVLQLFWDEDNYPDIKVCDRSATYADDRERPRGKKDPNKPWVCPPAFRGIER
jgi:hypothetical protein